MISKRHIYLLFLSSLMCSFVLLAQEQSQKVKMGGGAIDDVEVEIIRERQITLPKVDRNFDKIPLQSMEEGDKERVVYNFTDLQFSTPPLNLTIQPMRLKPTPIIDSYKHFIGGGFGNYIAPYLEAWTHIKRNYGAHIYHKSAFTGPVDEENSAFSYTQLEAYGRFYGELIEGNLDVDYQNSIGYFYGYEPGMNVNRDDIRQVYHRVNLKGTIANTKSGQLNSMLIPRFSYLTNIGGASEIDASVQFKGDYRIGKHSKILLSSSYTFINQQRKQMPDRMRHLFSIRPAYTFRPLKDLLLVAGINLVVSDDEIYSESIHLYPYLLVEYDITPNLTAYASVTGDMDKVSLMTTTKENFWVDDNTQFYHTNRTYQFSLGLQSVIAKKIVLEAGFSLEGLEKLYMYNISNSFLDEGVANFSISYNDFSRVNAYAQISYDRSENLTITARADYYHFTLIRQPPEGLLNFQSLLSQAWHRPSYQVALHATWNINKKILFNLGFLGKGGMSAFEELFGRVPDGPEDKIMGNKIALGPMLDLQASIRYFISRHVSVFVKAENIIGTTYPLYYRYPARGVQVMGGVGWSF